MSGGIGKRKKKNLGFNQKRFLFDGKCAYCQGTLRQPTVDHLWPVQRGGKNSPNNLVPCCFKCNQEKGMQVLGEGWNPPNPHPALTKTLKKVALNDCRVPRVWSQPDSFLTKRKKEDTNAETGSPVRTSPR